MHDHAHYLLARCRFLALAPISALVLLLVDTASSQVTNVFYLPADPRAYFSEKARANAEAEQLASLSNSPTAWPAELDPDGHWGDVTAGLQMSIRFSTNRFKLGEPIEAAVTLRNTAATRILLDTAGPWTIDFCATNANGQSLKPADRSKWYTYSGASSRSLPPRKQLTYQFKLNDIFDLKTPGVYSVSAKRLKDKWGDLPELESAIVKITIIAPR